MTRADKVIQFIQLLKCPDGKLVGQPFELRAWQKRWIKKVYREKNNHRVVRQAVMSMARKNGKTSLIAALALVHLCGPESVRNGQIYSVSYEREQASIVFKFMGAMIAMEPVLAARLRVLESRKQVIDTINGSTYQALSSESRSKHGKSASVVIFDELAQFGTDRELYDVMLTSSGAHDEPLFFVISTQAADHAAVMSELIDYGLSHPEDETFTVDLFSVPEDADIWCEENWQLANPALGDFRSLEEMRDFAQKAKAMPSAEAAFRNLYLNQRIELTAAWINRAAWEACAGEPQPCPGALRYGGLDLSAKNDLTALAWLLPSEDETMHAHLLAWTPEEGLADRARRDKAPYDLWVRQQYLRTTPGAVIDYRWVAAQIAAEHARHPFAAIAFDRWRIDDLKRELEEIDCQAPLVPHGQGYRDMGPAIETLEDLIISTRLRHGGHPLYNLACAKAVTVQDPAGNRKFEKKKSLGRIDPIVALSMAAAAWKSGTEGPQKSVYEHRGIRTL